MHLFCKLFEILVNHILTQFFFLKENLNHLNDLSSEIKAKS